MNIPSNEINTARLKIRKFRPSDKNAFISFMLNEKSTKHLNFTEEQKSKEGALTLLQLVIASYSSDNPIFSLAIERKEGHQYIGSLGVAPYGEKDEYECYYSINEEFTNRGFAKEAMNAILSYASTNNVKKIFAFCHPDNLASEKLALSIGMKFEGLIKRKDLPTTAKSFSISF